MFRAVIRTYCGLLLYPLSDFITSLLLLRKLLLKGFFGDYLLVLDEQGLKIFIRISDIL